MDLTNPYIGSANSLSLRGGFITPILSPEYGNYLEIREEAPHAM